MADPVKGIQLVGSPGALPADLAAQAAQAAIAQQLAAALLGSSMQSESPIVHTGGSNPFARDVPNLAPLGKIVQSLLGSKGLDSSSKTLADIASQGEARRQSDLGAAGAYIPTTVPERGAPGEQTPDMTPMMRPPSVLEQIQRLQMSSHPANQAIAQSLLEHQFTNEDKQMMTPSDYSSMTSPRGGNLTQEAIANRLAKLPLTGAPAFKMGMPGGAPVTGQPEVVDEKQHSKITTLPDGTVIAEPPGGGASVLKTPSTAAAEHTNESMLGNLEEGRGQARAFQSLVPVVGTMLKLAEAEKNNLGWGQPLLTEARQLAKRLGASDDDLGHISNVQTLMKYALVPAIQQAKSLTSRPSQMEFMKTLEASAADPRVDARAAANIFRGFLVNGLNNVTQHDNNLAIAEKMPGIKDQVANYRVPEMSGEAATVQQKEPPRPGEPKYEEGPSSKLERSVFPYLKGTNVDFTKSDNGIWYDRGVIDAPQAAAKAQAASNIPPSKIIGGKTYYNYGGGPQDWHDRPK